MVTDFHTQPIFNIFAKNQTIKFVMMVQPLEAGQLPNNFLWFPRMESLQFDRYFAQTLN